MRQIIVHHVEAFAMRSNTRSLLRSFVSCFALLACPLSVGCIAPPRTDSAGKITGGHPRLRALVRFIDGQRARLPHALADATVTPTYVGVIGPDEMSMFYAGELEPGKDGSPGVRYSLAASARTIDSERFAVVSESSLMPSGSTRTCCCLLEWSAQDEEWLVRRRTCTPPPEHSPAPAQSNSAPPPAAEQQRSRARFVFKDGVWQKQDVENSNTNPSDE